MPPRRSTRFLRWFCKPDLLEEIEGDLQEEYDERLQRMSATRARWIYAWQVLSFFRPFALRKFPFPTFFSHIMFTHYLKIAFRNLRRQILPSSIKVIGLSLGLATCTLIFMYVGLEQSFDRFHEAPEDIYRLVFETTREDGSTNLSPRTPMEALPLMNGHVPQTNLKTSFNITDYPIQDSSGQVHLHHQIAQADSNFLSVFSFPLEEGRVDFSGENLRQLLLTRSLADKMFPHQNPIGQWVKVMGWRDTLHIPISGILADVPETAHFTFELLLLSKKPARLRQDFDWSGFSYSKFTYLRMPSGFSPQQTETDLKSFIQATGGDSSRYAYVLQPLLDIHLQSHMHGEIQPNGDLRTVYLFTGIAILILLIAIINYILTVLADFSRRVKEIGIRKVNGALAHSIISQFFTETLLYLLLALPLVGIWVYLAMPSFSELVERSIDWRILWTSDLMWLLPLSVALVLLLSGLYPALLLGRLRIVASMKGQLRKLNDGAWIRKVLLTVQFAITLALFIGLGVIFRQLNYLQHKDMGFDKNHKLVVNLGVLNKLSKPIRQEMRKSPLVRQASLTNWVPARSLGGYGTFTTEEGGSLIEVQFFDGDEAVMEAYGLSLLQGRSFEAGERVNTGPDASPQDPIIVNQTLLRTLNLPEELGQVLEYPALRGRVIGIMEDFHIRNLYEPIKPVSYQYRDDGTYLVMAYQPGQGGAVLDHFKESWTAMGGPSQPPYFFLDEYLDTVYDKEDRLMNMLIAFGLIAISLACLGVFGLASFAAARRTKEIGIRKVLGAGLSQLLLLLNKEYLMLMGVSALLAVPLAWYFLQDWLNTFAYHIELSWGECAVALLVLIGLVSITVSLRSWRTARQNPAQALRTE